MKHKTYKVEIRDRITGELEYENTLYSINTEQAKGAALRHARDLKEINAKRVNIFAKEQ